MSEAETKTFILETKFGRRRVTVPADSRVTFGLVAPGSKGGGYNPEGGGGYCLRIYKGSNKENQLAVFTGVKEFREVGTVQMQEKQTRTQRKRVGREGKSGYADQIAEVRMEKWVDPDLELEDGDESEPETDYIALISSGDHDE